jgi:hypothetical protein
MVQKRKYSSPSLVAYGSLTALTGALAVTFNKVGSEMDDVTPFLPLLVGEPKPT